MSTTKKLTREQRADALLCFADAWQHGNPSGYGGSKFLDNEAPALWDEIGTPQSGGWYGLCASAALSEVAWHMGFSLVNADGTDTEKVTSFAPRRDCGIVREDGTRQVLYKAAKRPRSDKR